MKKTVLLTIVSVCLMFSSATYAQKHETGEKKNFPTKEQIIDYECQNLVKKLLLDDTTAKKFTQVYTDYRNEFFKIKNKYPNLRKSNKEEQMTDAQIEQKILNQFAQGKEIINVRENYYKKFRTFLTARQVNVIFDNERHRFNKFKHEDNRRKGNKTHNNH